MKSFFSQYNRYKEKADTSVLGAVPARFHRTYPTRRKLKLSLSAAMEKGYILPAIRRLSSSFMQLRIRSIGITLFLFGFLSAATTLIQYYTLGTEDLSAQHVLVGTTLMLLTIPVILSRLLLYEALSSGRILGRFLQVICGVRPSELAFTDDSPRKTEGAVIILGISLGLLTWWSPPLTLLLYLASVILAAFILYKPEVGVVTIAFAIPILSPSRLLFTVLWTTLSYVFKLIRGKRIFRMEPLDYFVLAFFILNITSGIFSLSPAHSLSASITRASLMLVYFLAVNLLKSSHWVNRTILMLFASSTICALLGVEQTFLSEAAGAFTSDALRAMSTFDTGAIFGSFLVLCLPFGFACFFGARYFRGKLWAFVSLFTMLGGLFFTLSRGAWLSLVISMLIFFFVYSRNTLVIAGSAILSLPFWFAVFPNFSSSLLLNLGTTFGSSIEYRSIVWQNSLKIFGDFWYCGIGTGESLFSAVYPSYATMGEAALNSHHLFLQIAIEYGLLGLIVFIAFFLVFAQKIFTFLAKNQDRTARLITIASFCAVFALLLRGTNDYVWLDSRVFCMFWLTAALGVAACNCADNEETGGEIIQ